MSAHNHHRYLLPHELMFMANKCSKMIAIILFWNVFSAMKYRSNGLSIPYIDF